MKKFVACLVLLAAVAVNADMIVDNFESYADSATLQAAWVPNAGSAISGETIETYTGLMNNKFMLLKTNGGGAGFMQTKLQLPGSVWNNHGVNLTYPGFTAISLRIAVPVNGSGPYGTLGGTGGTVFLSMFDCWGQKVLGMVYPGTAPTPGGTGMTLNSGGALFTIPFAGNTVAGRNLENVYQITVGFEGTWYGTGALLVDDVTLIGVPEPATMSILALGGLLLRKRK